MTIRRMIPVLATVALVTAGCGGSGEDAGGSVTADERIEACLQQQPDATRADCESWEQDGELADDGTHQGHDA